MSWGIKTFGINAASRRRSTVVSNPLYMDVQADQGTYQNDDRTSAATANDDPVKSWDGINGTNCWAKKSSGNPVLKTNVLGGGTLPAVYFSGTILNIVDPDEVTHTQITVLVVGKTDAFADNYPVTFGNGAGVPGTYMGMEIGSNAGGDVNHLDIIGGSGQDSRAELTDIALDAVWHVWAWTIDGNIDQTRVWDKGTEATMTPLGSASLSLQLGNSTGTSGQGFIGGFGLTGHVAQLTVWDGILADIDVLEAISDAQAKWSI